MNQTVGTPSVPDQIDGEHKVQLELLNALEASIGGVSGVVDLDEILEQYVSYSDLHFMSEQLLMRLYAYPDYDDHVREHEALSERMREIRNRQRAGDVEGLADSVAEQKAALLAHMRVQDRAFDRYLKNPGAATA